MALVNWTARTRHRAMKANPGNPVENKTTERSLGLVGEWTERIGRKHER